MLLLLVVVLLWLATGHETLLGRTILRGYL
jgi:hypothetical protein